MYPGNLECFMNGCDSIGHPSEERMGRGSGGKREGVVEGGTEGKNDWQGWAEGGGRENIKRRKGRGEGMVKVNRRVNISL